MRRREFIAGLGGAAAWPLVARAQKGRRVPLVCVLEAVSTDTPNAEARYAAFSEGLERLGWTPGRNVQVEMRWGGGDEAAIRKYAADPKVAGAWGRYTCSRSSAIFAHYC